MPSPPPFQGGGASESPGQDGSRGPHHQPVMVEEVLAYLGEPGEGWVLDATVGTGGHAGAILARFGGVGLVGVDRDGEVLGVAGDRLKAYGDRVRLLHADFTEKERISRESGVERFRAVICDAGVSTWQIGTAERGFSFRLDGPVDMRMDRSQPETAEDLIRRLPDDELERILREYGGEPSARRIVRAIRQAGPLCGTVHLAQVIAGAVRGRKRVHPATQAFMAIRIALNGELDRLDRFLRDIETITEDNGRVLAVCYHSGEDRIVKVRFREKAAQGTGRLILGKPLRPRAEEVRANPRARSARMRVLEVLHASR